MPLIDSICRWCPPRASAWGPYSSLARAAVGPAAWCYTPYRGTHKCDPATTFGWYRNRCSTNPTTSGRVRGRLLFSRTYARSSGLYWFKKREVPQKCTNSLKFLNWNKNRYTYICNLNRISVTLLNLRSCLDRSSMRWG